MSLFKTISITPVRIKIIPIAIFSVKISWKNIKPKIIAVNGSKAPNIAVIVGPTNFIPIVVASSEIIVGIIANPNANAHKIGEFKACNSVQKFKLYTYTDSPKNIT